MEVKFFRCYFCGRTDEDRILRARFGCVCGGKRVVPTRLTVLELVWYLVKHPSYIRGLWS